MGDEAINLTGPTGHDVFFEGPSEGDAFDDDLNGLDEVETEMVALNLTGTSSTGPVTLTHSPVQDSPGMMEDLVNNTPGTLDIQPFRPSGSVDSFFDVFFEIDIDPITGLRTGGPRQITFPPDDEAARIKKYDNHQNGGTARMYYHQTDDMHPCYLPDGGIVFTSSRCEYGTLCDGKSCPFTLIGFFAGSHCLPAFA